MYFIIHPYLSPIARAVAHIAFAPVGGRAIWTRYRLKVITAKIAAAVACATNAGAIASTAYYLAFRRLITGGATLPAEAAVTVV